MKNKVVSELLESCSSVLVVGSSPLLLMFAVSLAKKGKQVTIISKAGEWGGSWQYTEYKGKYVDMACHLLESYAISHNILNAFNIDLIPLSRNNQPVKVLDEYPDGAIRLVPYHSKINIAREMCHKLLGLIKLLIIPIVHPRKANVSQASLLGLLSDLRLLLLYRLSQLFNLLPVNIPRQGWPFLVKSLTEQVHALNINVIDDLVTCITKAKTSLRLSTLSGYNLTGDVVIVGQATVLQRGLHKILSRNQFSNASKALKTYPHFLVEVIGLPAKLEIPCYIHFPRDPTIHRITTSFESEKGYHCLLVQTRHEDISHRQFQDRLLQILNSITTKIYPGFKGDLGVFILDKYEPVSVSLEKQPVIKPGFYKGVLVLRTLGDLSRNIVFHHDLLT